MSGLLVYWFNDKDEEAIQQFLQQYTKQQHELNPVILTYAYYQQDYLNLTINRNLMDLNNNITYWRETYWTHMNK